MDNETTVRELNAILKGERMAVESYDKFEKAVKNNEVKKMFNEFSQDHSLHIEMLEARIQKLGGEPDKGTGIAGFFAGAVQSLENMMDRNDQDIIKKAYDGEDKGIGMTEEVIQGDLDEDSMYMVKKIMSKDHDHLKKMDEMINKTEQ